MLLLLLILRYNELFKKKKKRSHIYMITDMFGIVLKFYGFNEIRNEMPLLFFLLTH